MSKPLWLSILYAIVLITGGAIVSTILPPLQAPDEASHFLHAAQIAGGSLLPRATGGTPGGIVDKGYIALARIDAVNRVPFHTNEKFDRASIAAAASLRHDGASELFPNGTSFYFPTGYVFQAIGIRLAGLFTDRVLIHLIAARMANAAAAAFIIGLAIMVFPAAAPVFVTVAALPMSVCVMNSASQDALLVSASILFAALCLRLLCLEACPADGAAGWRSDPRQVGIAAFAVVLVLALGRATYLTFAAIPATGLLLIDWRRHAVLTVVSLLFVSAAVVGYLAYVGRLGPLVAGPGANMQAQWQGVIANPSVFLRALWLTISSRIANETIGIIGYGDSPLPPVVYPAARIAGIFALATTAIAFSASRVRSTILANVWASIIFVIVALLAVTMSVILTGLETYLQMAPVGIQSDVFLQGRYFVEYLPTVASVLLAPLLALPIKRMAWISGQIEQLVSGAVIAFVPVMVASFAAMGWTIVDRFYLH